MDHARVQQWAQRALDAHAGETVLKRMVNAFGETKALRDKGNTELELAAADHYLYCRMCNCAAGISPLVYGGTALSAVVYDVYFKAVHTVIEAATGSGLIPRFGSGVVSPFSIWTLPWDYTGIMNGFEDFFRRWGHAPTTVPLYPVPLPTLLTTK